MSLPCRALFLAALMLFVTATAHAQAPQSSVRERREISAETDRRVAARVARVQALSAQYRLVHDGGARRALVVAMSLEKWEMQLDPMRVQREHALAAGRLADVRAIDAAIAEMELARQRSLAGVTAEPSGGAR